MENKKNKVKKRIKSYKYIYSSFIYVYKYYKEKHTYHSYIGHIINLYNFFPLHLLLRSQLGNVYFFFPVLLIILYLYHIRIIPSYIVKIGRMFSTKRLHVVFIINIVYQYINFYVKKKFTSTGVIIFCDLT